MCVCVCVCVVSVIVKRPVLPPCVVDGLSRNPLLFIIIYDDDDDDDDDDYDYDYYYICMELRDWPESCPDPQAHIIW